MDVLARYSALDASKVGGADTVVLNRTHVAEQSYCSCNGCSAWVGTQRLRMMIPRVLAEEW